MASHPHQAESPAPWMTDPAVIKVIQALGAPEVDVRFVGGCVRDALLKRATADIDIATPDLPDTVAERLVNAGLKVVPTGLSHGTVTAVADSRGFEITTLRKDTACDGRHAAVEFTTDWEEDASRRDFTFNALSQRPDGTLFDPFCGVADAQAGVIRFVGDPQDRIKEDYLRILRFFRFLAHYGKAAPAADILKACDALKSGLDHLSAERVRTEVVKLLQAGNPLIAINAMIETGVLSQIAGGEVGSATLSRLVDLEQHASDAKNLQQDWPQRWVALFGDQAEHLSTQLKCSGKEQSRISNIVQAAQRAETAFQPPALYHFLHDFDAKTAAAGVLVAWARMEDSPEGDWLNLCAHAQAKRPAPFPVSGADVRSLGVAEGPAIGTILAELEAQWVESGFKLSKKDLKTRLQSLVGQSPSP